MVESIHTHAAISTWPGRLRAPEAMIFSKVDHATTPEKKKLSTNKASTIVFQDEEE